MSRLIDVSTWLAKIPHCPTGGFSFWDYFWCWNPAAAVNRDLNGISQRGGSGEQAWSQGSVPGFCRPTANGRFEKRQRTVKKKYLTKTLSSCSSRTAIFSNIPTFLHSLVQSRDIYTDKVCKSKKCVLCCNFKQENQSQAIICKDNNQNTHSHPFLHPGRYNGLVPLQVTQWQPCQEQWTKSLHILWMSNGHQCCNTNST